jgi:hypothetical protein
MKAFLLRVDAGAGALTYHISLEGRLVYECCLFPFPFFSFCCYVERSEH